MPRKERRKRQQRAVVDITAVIHLSDSPPNAPLGETQSCVTSNAANAQPEHACLHTCTYGNKSEGLLMSFDTDVNMHKEATLSF